MSLKACLASLLLSLFAVNLAQASDADIRKAAAQMLRPGVTIDEIRKLDVADLYEVRVGSNVFYSDEKGNYFIMGDITDTRTRINITEERRTKLSAIKFSDLPLSQAIKTVRGNGKRVFATFEDPNCGYCKKLAKEIVGMTDFTMYTFLYPILSPDSHTKSRNIWCAKDPSKAWISHMTTGSNPANITCDTPLEKNLTLGQRLNVHGTPHIILANGERLPGYVSAEQLSERLDAVMKASNSK